MVKMNYFHNQYKCACVCGCVLGEVCVLDLPSKFINHLYILLKLQILFQ